MLETTPEGPILLAEPDPRPLHRLGADAVWLAGGPLGFERWRLTRLGRGDDPGLAAFRATWSSVAEDAARDPDAAALRTRICGRRRRILGLAPKGRPLVMGVINVTPDSFSDGGRHFAAERAVEAGLAMAAAGADILDIGGESTRPGAEPVPLEEELARVLPVLEGLAAAGCVAPRSIDTRKAAVARAAFAAGARLFNDVSALTHDPAALETAAALMAETDGWVCLMHAQGDPRAMQANPSYRDAPLEVAAYLAARVAAAEAAGAPRSRILVDPGIGFGKTLAHNVALLRRLALLHSTGCAILLGVSRKRFIGVLSGVDAAADRVSGSVAAALEGAAAGAQVVRVHDVAETLQALRVWGALAGAGDDAAATAEREARA